MDINSILQFDEQFLWSGKGTPQKPTKEVLYHLGIIAFCCVFLGVVIMLIKNVDGVLPLLPFLFAGIAMIALCIYKIRYAICVRPKRVLQTEYYLTTQRAIIYDNVACDYYYGNLRGFSEFRIDNFNGLYGDVYMGKVFQSTQQDSKDALDAAKTVLYKDKTDMPFICFEGVENPAPIMQMAKDASQKLNSVT